MNISIEDAPSARTYDELALSKQLTYKRSKEYLLCDKTVLAVSENILMHYNMIFGKCMMQLTGG